MPRSRKQVARFDPSPESVASWNNTSGKNRRQADIHARTRHGLSSTEAAALLSPSVARDQDITLTAAPATEAAEELASARGGGGGGRSVSVPAPARGGRKRQRAVTGAAAAEKNTDPYDGGPTWPPIPNLLEGRMEADDEERADTYDVRNGGGRSVGGSGSGGGGGGGGGGGSNRRHRHGSSVTDSSLSCSTSGSGSGSDSDSSYSCPSVVSSRATLPWRRPSAAGGAANSGTAAMAAAAGAGAGAEEEEEVEEAEEAQLVEGGSTAGASASASVSASGTDTDSEYCSDPVQLPGPAVSGSSGGCSSCSAPVLAVKASSATVAAEVEVMESCGSRSVSGGVALPSKKMKVARERDGGGGGCGRQGIRNGVEEEQPKTKKRRNVVTLRLARSKMPSRWAAPPPPFETCLNDVRPEDRLGGGVGGGDSGAWGGGDDAGAGAAAAAASMLGLWEGDVVDAKNWLSSGFIDVVMAKFARTYPDVHFMPIDFAVLCLNGWGVAEAAPRPRYAPSSSSASSSSSSASCSSSSSSSSSLSSSSSTSSPLSSSSCSAADRLGGAGSAGGGASAVAGAAAAAAALEDEGMTFRDILGRPIVYSERRPVIFLTHVNNVHWNLLRVEHDPVPELQLFEPMGKPPRRQGGSRAQSGAAGSSGSSGGASSSSSRGTGFRCIPKEVYRWLDAVWPLGAGEPRSPGRAGSPRSGGVGAWGGGGDGGGDGGSGSGKKRKASSKKAASDGGWAFRAYSAITRQQQTTGFDCGVAALLYAEKCGQGQMREDVDAWTTQRDMTEYRRSLQRYVQEVLRCQSSSSSSSAAASSSSSSEAAAAATAEADAAAVSAAAAVRVAAAATAAAEVSAAAAAAEAAAAAAGLALAAAAAAVEASSPFFSSTPSLFSSASSPLSPSPLLPEACLGAALLPLSSNPLHNPPSQGGSPPPPPPPPLPPPPPAALVPLLPPVQPPSAF